ncbi:hypothetical protein Droror1_Dr00000734 [Drosera rotundifolia]
MNKITGKTLVKERRGDRNKRIHTLQNQESKQRPIFQISAKFSSAAMDSIKGQESIQVLLTAEQEAQKIIADAKNMKMQRLRQAKEEAEEEINRYRAHLEEEHQRKISESSGSSGSNVRRLEEETNIKIQNLKDSASSVSPQIVALLYKYVATVAHWSEARSGRLNKSVD